MLAQQLKILTNTFITLAFCTLPSLAAPESEPELVLESLSKSSTTDSLPLGTLLDSQGKPLPIPAEQSALDYSPPTVNVDNTSPKTKTNKTQSTKTKNKKLSRKQQLASRDKVANDPSCRWLDARMSQLETQIGNKREQAADYHSDELNARKQEWQCLKCGVEGPNPDDYHRCQYRR